LLGLVVAAVAALVVGAFRPSPVPPPFGRNGAIAYDVSDLSGRPYNHVHLIGVAGGDVELAQGSCPRFSADGTVLAYSSGWAETAKVYVSSPDGSSPRLLPGIGDSQFALSPDGSRIAWLKALEDIVTPTSGGGSFVRSQNELWVSPTSGGQAQRLAAPEDVAEDFWTPVWSPDGGSIAFAVNRWMVDQDNQWFYRIAFDVVAADGSGRRRLTSRVGSDVSTDISWSPDGRSLVFAGAPDGTKVPNPDPVAGSQEYFWPELDIFVIGADGTAERNITGTDASEFDPAWAPDGGHLAYVAFTTVAGGGAYHLTSARMDGANLLGPVAVGGPADSFAWSPNGSRLLWVETEGSGSNDQVDSVLRTSDADFLEAPATVASPGWPVSCVSWQRLAP
jgi:Tol biopolymer transport system component